MLQTAQHLSKISNQLQCLLLQEVKHCFKEIRKHNDECKTEENEYLKFEELQTLPQSLKKLFPKGK